MGCDIHSFIEVRKDGRWVHATGLGFPMLYGDPGETVDEPFYERQYSVFGFLADVRNYSHSPVIVQPRGLPDDVSAGVRHEYEEWLHDAHHNSWLTVAELLTYDYDQVFWDRRVTKNGNGAALADEGEGTHLLLRDFLGDHFFERLRLLARLGDPEHVRVVFWFDN